MPTSARLAHASVALVYLVLALGCSQLDLNEPIPWFWETEELPSVPASVTAVWTDTVLHKPDRLPTRGLGGRLMFYAKEVDEPVLVEGTLVVYAFDEEGRRPTDAKPDRKYVFPTEQFARHHSKSDLGHSYSVWIPWDEVGGPQKEISLIVRFLPSEGPVVVGAQTKHLLPGVSRPAPAAQAGSFREAGGATIGQNTVRPVSHETTIRPLEAQAEAGGASTQQMRTHTIVVPSNFGRRSPTAVVHPRSTRAGTALQQPAPAGSAAEQTVPSASPLEATSRTLRRPARFSRSRSRARGAPTAQPAHDRAPWQPHPAGWPSDPQ